VSSKPARWPHGSQIALRYRNTGRLSWISAASVLEDSADLIALYMPSRSLLKVQVRLDGLPLLRPLPDAEKHEIRWRLGDALWGEQSVLWVSRPGQQYAVGMFWRDAEPRFLGWYVSMQAPLMRSPVGFDTIDHILTLAVSPDRSSRWLAEEEFADALRFGRLTPSEAARIRAAGNAAVTQIEHRAWPFDVDWEDWRPGAGWPSQDAPLNREAG
jgi:hypothetical protein